MVRRGDNGVTLIEMLVVLSVISIAAGVLILRFSATPGTDPRAEADRLAAVLTEAAEAALYSGNPGALIWSDDSYRVAVFTQGAGWQAASGAPQRDLAGGVTLRRDDGRDGPLMIAPGGIALPASFLVTSSGPTWQVYFNGLSAEVRAPGAVGPVLQ